MPEMTASVIQQNCYYKASYYLHFLAVWVGGVWLLKNDIINKFSLLRLAEKIHLSMDKEFLHFTYWFMISWFILFATY